MTPLRRTIRRWIARARSAAPRGADVSRSVARAARACRQPTSSAAASSREGAALSGAGKRAAFALFYGPLHYLSSRTSCAQLPGRDDSARHDRRSRLRHGRVWRGVGGARAATRRRGCSAIDRHPWAVGEARATYRAFGIPATRASGRRRDRARCRSGPAVDSRGVHAERAGRCRARRAARRG